MDALLDIRAFTLGMVALLNPCGFALLPAYLGFFLGSDEEETGGRTANTLISLNRAQIVGLSMSAGFLAVFGALGILLAGSLTAVQEAGWLPRITIIIGVGLALLGAAMLAGFNPLVNLPKLNKGGGSRSAGSMFMFGVSYALASLSCTIGLFLSAVGNSSSGASFGQRLGSFVSYGIGMGLLATVLTLAVSFGRKSLVNRFRAATAHMARISAIILVIVGVYVALYGIWSQQVLDFNAEPTGWIDAIVITVEGWQASLTGWMSAPINPFGLLDSTVARTSVMGYAFLAINLLVAIGGLAARGASKAKQESNNDELVGAR